MTRHLVIGASHALFMSQALGRFEADWNRASQGTIEIEVEGAAAAGDSWHLLFLTPRTHFLHLRPSPHGPVVAVDPALVAVLTAFDTPATRVVCLIGGNEHNAHFMTAHAQPFDFVHPRGPALQPGRQVLPRSVVQRVLQGSLQPTMQTLRALAGLLPQAQRFLVAPPPPIDSEAQIRSHPEIFDFARCGIEDAGVRLKAYEVLIDELTAAAQDLRYTFLAAPPAHRSADGFLAEPFWHYATHAQPAYYAPLWQQLRA